MYIFTAYDKLEDAQPPVETGNVLSQALLAADLDLTNYNTEVSPKVAPKQYQIVPVEELNVSPVDSGEIEPSSVGEPDSTSMQPSNSSSLGNYTIPRKRTQHTLERQSSSKKPKKASPTSSSRSRVDNDNRSKSSVRVDNGNQLDRSPRKDVKHFGRGKKTNKLQETTRQSATRKSVCSDKEKPISPHTSHQQNSKKERAGSGSPKSTGKRKVDGRKVPLKQNEKKQEGHQPQQTRHKKKVVVSSSSSSSLSSSSSSSSSSSDSSADSDDSDSQGHNAAIGKSHFFSRSSNV